MEDILPHVIQWVSSRNLPSTACRLATPGCGALDLILETELARNTRPHRLFVSCSMDFSLKVFCSQVFGFTPLLELSHEGAKLCCGRDFILGLPSRIKSELPHFTRWIVADPDYPRKLLKASCYDHG